MFAVLSPSLPWSSDRVTVCLWANDDALVQWQLCQAYLANQYTGYACAIYVIDSTVQMSRGYGFLQLQRYGWIA